MKTTDRYKLIRYPELETGPEWELFDLKRDPKELNNLASDPTAEPLLDALRTKLQTMRREVKEPVGPY